MLICLDIFREDECLYPSRSVRLCNNKVSFGPENKKLSKKLLVLKFGNVNVKLKDLYY